MSAGHAYRVSGAVLVLELLASPAFADRVTLGIDNNAWNGNANLGTYPPGSNALIDYEVFVSIDTDAGAILDNQGLAGFQFDVLSNIGATQPHLEVSRTSSNPAWDVTIRFLLWQPFNGGDDALFVGGFGMGFDVSGGDNSTPGSVTGIRASMYPTWDADLTYNPSITNPAALAGVGFGTPGVGTYDTGGNPFPFYPSYTTPRAEWYLMRGQIQVPDAPGTYTVSVDNVALSLIRADADLNNDLSDHWTFDVAPGHTDVIAGSFSFTVLPEPAAASLLLLSAALAAIRRRR